MVCWGFGDFFIQRTVRKIGDVEALAFIGLIGAIGLLPVVIYELPSLLELQNLSILLVLGVITFVAAMFNFEALKEGKLSVVDVIIQLELPVTVILGMVLFGEVISAVQAAVICAAFAGIILISLGSSPSKLFKGLEKGAALAFATAVGLGMVNFLTAASARQISPLMAIWAPWMVFSAICFVVISRREGIRKTLSNAARFKWIVLGMGIFDTLAWLFFALATAGNLLAITIAITESYPAITIFLGIHINKEKIAGHQCIGAGIALASSFVLGFLV